VLITDFLPHAVEALRDEHAHRRLGFADDEVIEWLSEANIVNVEARHLQPKRDGDLVVGIWTGVKAEA
jgi:ArsR family transcriptional regulator